MSPQTGAKNLSAAKTFFEFCLSNEWIARNPARPVKNPRGPDAADRRNEQKLPLSDDAQAFAVAEENYDPDGPVDTSYAQPMSGDILALERDCPAGMRLGRRWRDGGS